MPHCLITEHPSKASSSKASSSKGKAKDVSYHDDDQPSLSSTVDKCTQALLKQDFKYSRKWSVSTVLFYDYDYLLAIQPPAELEPGSNLTLTDVTICPEYIKSTEARAHFSLRQPCCCAPAVHHHDCKGVC